MIAEFIDFQEFDNEFAAIQCVNDLMRAGRQVTACMFDGVWTVSTPIVGERNPAAPQPTPPREEALRMAA
jgi:hypothetical protein